MKTLLKSSLLAVLLAGTYSCKKTDDCAPAQDTTAITVTDSTTVDSSETADGKPVKKYLKYTPERKKLTQHQKDSIKTERGALVTPPDNVGPSLTPGSGKAVPGNTKTGPGTPANMGSSAKTD